MLLCEGLRADRGTAALEQQESTLVASEVDGVGEQQCECELDEYHELCHIDCAESFYNRRH